MTDDATGRPPRWPWAWFALAAAWSVLIRVPLILNAASHVDSDLAVDGIVLREAIEGRWRWHYPGTPHIGAAAVLLSWPQARLLGASPATLVSGGTVAALGLLLGSFRLAWRAAGPTAAAWSLVPLTFASTGAVWLSGRITGGHLLAAAWHAGAFALLVPCLRRGGAGPSLALGLWSGFGLYLDSMFAVTLAGLLPAALAGWCLPGPGRRPDALALAAFAVGAAVGFVPRVVGERSDPYNAYGPQFEAVRDPELLLGHASLLARDCLPRLIVGHRLPGLESDPDPTGLTAPSAYRTPTAVGPVAIAATGLGLLLWGASWLAILRRALAPGDRATRLVAAGLLLSAIATGVGFVVNRNIFNSDNYRYLVTWLVPWSFGFGLLMDGAWRRGAAGKSAAVGLSLAFAGLMSADLAAWYSRYDWVDDRYAPRRASAADPLSDWLDRNRDVTWIEGGYWDVYRLAFLSGGRVRGAPFPVYPNRFPDWEPAPGAGRALLARPSPEGRLFLDEALRDGGQIAETLRGVSIVRLPAANP